jgi:membrane-associated phospholipid phosphatase
LKTLARIISAVFHPVMIPTFGFLLLFYTGTHFSLLNYEVKKFILIATFFSTFILPVLTISIMALNPKFNFHMENQKDRVLPLLFTALYYYLGYSLIKSLYMFPLIRTFFITSVILLILLLLISIKWKISIHSAAIGGFIGTLIAVSFRSGDNPVWLLIGSMLVAGFVGSARLYLGKHNLAQVLGGFTIGLATLYLSVLYS